MRRELDELEKKHFRMNENNKSNKKGTKKWELVTKNKTNRKNSLKYNKFVQKIMNPWNGVTWFGASARSTTPLLFFNHLNLLDARFHQHNEQVVNNKKTPEFYAKLLVRAKTSLFLLWKALKSLGMLDWKGMKTQRKTKKRWIGIESDSRTDFLATPLIVLIQLTHANRHLVIEFGQKIGSDEQ